MSRGRKCVEGCVCGRHVSRKCVIGCTCPQHNKKGGRPKGSIAWNKGLKGVQKAWNKGISVPEEQKKRQKETLNNWLATLTDEERKAIFGREKSAEIRKQISDALKGNQKLSDLMTQRRKEQPQNFQGGYGQTKAGIRSDLGFYVRSTWEANVARILKIRLEKGEISEFSYEPKRFDFETIKRGVRSYLPDFRIVLPTGEVEWIEVKGWWTQRAKVAVKRFAQFYPNEVLYIIDKPKYIELKLEYKEQILEWED